MEGFTLKLLNEVQNTTDIYSYFETSNMLSIDSANVIDFSDVNLYRGLNYMGISLKNNLICFDSIGKNEGFIQLENDVQMLSNSFDGRFLLVLTKKKFIYLIYTPSKRIIYKTALVVNEGDIVKKAVIVSLNESLSEIWIFLNESVTVYRNINFYELEQAILSDNSNRKNELLSQIIIEETNFQCLKRDGPLIDIHVLKSKRCNQFFMAILFPDYLVVLNGFVEYNRSCVEYFYETDISHFGITLLERVKPSMAILPDEVHIFIIDCYGALWICNFLMGCVFRQLKPDNGVFDDVSLTTELCVVSKKHANNLNSVEILTFPALKSIESFSISSCSVLFPIPDTLDTILFIDSLTLNSIMLRSIRRLDPIIRLKEIIATNNFESAFKFATTFSMDKETIYIHQLKYLLQTVNNYQQLSEGQYKDLCECMKEIKTFFDLDIFECLLRIVMPSVNEHGFLLHQIQAQTLKVTKSNESVKFLKKVEYELDQFKLFKIFCRNPNFTISNWKDFRNFTNVDILFLTITFENLDFLPLVWPSLQNGLDSMYNSNENFCQSILNLIKEMIHRHRNVTEFEKFLKWLIHDILPRQVEICPEKLCLVTRTLEAIIRHIEATRDKEYRNMSIDILRETILLLRNIHNESHTAIKKANVECAGLMSYLELNNPVLPLSRLSEELMQLNKLYSDYNLDLNLKLLNEESKINLASRLLDQISTQDLNNNFALPKLKSFLKEFNLRSWEFFYNYIKRLIGQYTLRLVDDLENRFIALLPNIEVKQIRLECLEAFASKADVPFKDSLKELLAREISINSPNNATVQRLKLLQRKSKLTPVLNRYAIKYANIDKLVPEKIISRILQNEDSLSLNIIENDVSDIAKLYNMADIRIMLTKCRVYVSNCVGTDDVIASDNLQKLKSLINCKIYPDSTITTIVTETFEYFLCLLRLYTHMSYWDLMFVLDVLHWLASKFPDKVFRYQWQTAIETTKFSVRFSHQKSDGDICLSNIIGSDSCPMMFVHGQLRQIKLDLTNSIRTVIESFMGTNSYTHRDVDVALWNCVSIVADFCFDNLNKVASFFIEICQEILQTIIDSVIEVDEYLACCIMYADLHLIVRLGRREKIYRQSYFVLKVVAGLLKINLECNVYIFWNILVMLSKVFDLYIYHNIGYALNEFVIASSMVTFLKVIVRSFAELESPSKFVKIKLTPAYQELPSNLDFKKYVPLIKLGLESVSYMDSKNFHEKLSTFNVKMFLTISNFYIDGLMISGYMSAVNLLTISLEEEGFKSLLDIFKSNSIKKIYTKVLDDQLKNADMDQPFTLCMLLSLPRDLVVEKLRAAMKNCRSNRIMMAIYTVTTELLKFESNFFSDDEKRGYVKFINSEIRKHYWGIKLKPYKIQMSRFCDESHITKTAKEILQNVNVPLHFVNEFLDDFGFAVDDIDWINFQNLFDIDFDKSHSIDSYKKLVETIIKRATEVWNHIPVQEQCYFKVVRYLGKVIEVTSPYHYEILEFVYSIMNTVTFEHEWEPKILKQLYSWIRTSPVSEAERLTCERNNKTSKFGPHATYLTSVRLPFHLLMYDDPMIVLERELHSSNVAIWNYIYQMLRIGGVNKTKINNDLLHLKTTENIFKDFMNYSKISDKVEDNRVTFVGSLFEISSSWFKDVVTVAISFLDHLLDNVSVLDFVDKKLDELLVKEHRIYFLDATLQWVDQKLNDGLCNGQEALQTWKRKKLVLKETLSVEEILFDTNLYKEDYLNYISHYPELLKLLISQESMSWNLNNLCKQNVMSAFMRISALTNIDRGNLAMSLIESTLNLLPNDHNMSSSSDHETSMLNMSMDGSICESKTSVDINHPIDTRKIELFSMVPELRYAVSVGLVDFIKSHNLTLNQWLNVFFYLFRAFTPGDNDDIDRLRSRDTLSLLLVLVECHSLNVDMPAFSDCDLTSLLGYLERFRDQDKTDLVRRLYCGDQYRHGALTADHRVEPRVMRVLKDLVALCPDSVDDSDAIVHSVRTAPDHL